MEQGQPSTMEEGKQKLEPWQNPYVMMWVFLGAALGLGLIVWGTVHTIVKCCNCWAKRAEAKAKAKASADIDIEQGAPSQPPLQVPALSRRQDRAAEEMAAWAAQGKDDLTREREEQRIKTLDNYDARYLEVDLGERVMDLQDTRFTETRST